MDPRERASKLKEVFPKVLTRLRKEKLLSMNELAQRSQLSQPFVVQLENGDRSPSLETAARLACGLELSLRDLIKEVEAAME